MAIINGSTQQSADGKTVLEYLESTGFDIKRVAVEINGEILPKAMYPKTLICEGDSIEIVGFVGGG